MNKILFPLIFLTAAFLEVPLSTAEENTPLIVTVREYCSMLNAVATGDPLRLYSDAMAAHVEECGVMRAEASDGYSYAMIPGMENQPMKELSQQQYDYYFHWVEQGSLQGEEEIASPLMMFGEEQKENPKTAREKLFLEQQQVERNRQAIDASGNDASAAAERSLSPVAIKEKSAQQPPREIQIGTPPDDISDMTGGHTTPESQQRSRTASFHEARKNLRFAREKVAATSEYLDFCRGQWEACNNAQLRLKELTELQQHFAVSRDHWQSAAISLQKAQAAAHEAQKQNDPACVDLMQEVDRTWQKQQELIFPLQVTTQNYYFAQQQVAAYSLLPGVDYNIVLNEAQLRANEADLQLQQCEAAVRKIKFEKP